MMDPGNVLLFLHVIGAAGWIGGATFAYFFLGRLAKEGGAERGRSMESFMDRLRQYGAVAIPLLLLTGEGLVLVEDQWSWGDTFVWVGIGAAVVSGSKAYTPERSTKPSWSPSRQKPKIV